MHFIVILPTTIHIIFLHTKKNQNTEVRNLFCINLVKTYHSKGKSNPVLKISGHLIILIFGKQKKKLLKMFQGLFYFFRIFLRFYGSRSLQIRAVFFHTTQTRFYIDFSRNRPSLKCTPRYEDQVTLLVSYRVGTETKSFCCDLVSIHVPTR